ncbi:MAG: efflux RND transporter permease subunit [Spirochaetales bacterium]|uniref:Efflux RND transporter permease subunit n=1 Tax=Candidatus Thalassospirochaeta sargassi TaxID=3119039 RepID=A0AAJ1MLF1_9SPIO|nr:efflux RND transporter permease subunit [Spirochaetales bacterium]
MNISELSVRRPVAILMVYILICGVAAIFVPQLAVDMFPSTDFPMLMVTCSYTGAGPEEIEKNLTDPLEDALASLEDLEEISSTSYEGSTRIRLSYGFDKDMDEAADDVQAVLDSINNLPDDAEDPVLRQFDMSTRPIIRLEVAGNAPIEELKELAENVAQPILERVPGVAQADVSGGMDRIVTVEISANRLEAYGLTMSQVSSALSSANIQMSSGSLTSNSMDYLVRTDEEFASIEEIKQCIIKTISSPSVTESVNRSKVVRLEDIAEVYEDYDEGNDSVWVNGVRSVGLRVYDESDANSIQVSKGVNEALAAINTELPEGVELVITLDDTSMTASSMNQVYQAAFQGILLAVIIIFLFLRSLKSTLVIAFSLPISILITLACMYFMGLTLNMMTMSGLILGVGMIVDCSIVILENIHRYRERGAKAKVAAILGSREMLSAIVASTLTTLCVFIPVLLFKSDLEMLGEMFEELVITVIISLVCSLFVAVTLVPSLCGGYLRLDTRVQKPLRFKLFRVFDNTSEKILTGLESGYRTALNWVLNNKLLVLTLVFTLFVLSIQQFTSLGMNMSMRPSTDDQVSISLSMPEGTTSDVTEANLFAMAEIIEREVHDYENLIIKSDGDHTGSIDIALPDLEDQTQSAAEIMSILRSYLTDFPSATFTFSAGRHFGSDSAVDVAIYSDDVDLSEQVADDIVEILQTVPDVLDPVSSLESGGPEMAIVIDRDRASSMGISVSTVGTEIKYLLDGITATTFRLDGEEMDIVLNLEDADKSTVLDLSSFYITGSNGRVLLSNIASLIESRSPSSITREDRTRIIHVTADASPTAAVSELTPLVESALAEQLILPDGVELEMGGEFRQMQEFNSSLIIIVIVAILLVFGVMSAQFESLLDPFIILFSIPLLLIGVSTIYKITGQPFSTYAAVGIVALVGVVVNNAIVLVDYTNTLRGRGMPLRQACLEAGSHRMRPILMTSLTTILGMVPMAFFPGEGAEQIQPIGQTMVGGLISSTFMTLFVVPSMYYIFNKGIEERRNKKKEQFHNEIRTAGEAV